AVSRRTGEGRCDQGSRRRQLINLAYRLLGSLAEAEDAVQETYARWYALSRQQQDAIESPGAWLMTVASRICLDVARGAPGLTILERTVNGQPDLVAQHDGVTVTVFAFDVAGDRIRHIWAVRNPGKLRPWTTG